ncbi:MAG TPA: LD-carboxypeptidase [Flavipsychrobacter sp.]|nr:LD-carboxypeptidase [Flavipsychrobacter sp.]
MNVPPYLQAGDTIGITCPSGYMALEGVAYAVTVLKSWDFNIAIGNTVGSEHFYFSGTDEERLNELQGMIDDDCIHAIMMGRGGYGLSRIIDSLDFTKFKDKPKWICGLSDITVLHNHIQAMLGIPTLHSVMGRAFSPQSEHSDYIKCFRDAITGNPLQYSSPPSPFNRSGTAEGILTGGNLALLAHLTGSASEVDTTGKILFIEDVGEYLYNVDRMMLNLKRAGKLDKLSGLILGSFTDMKDTERPFGQTLEEIIWDKVSEYEYPVCFNFPAGHQDINYTLTLGMNHRLMVNENGGHMELLR